MAPRWPKRALGGRPKRRAPRRRHEVRSKSAPRGAQEAIWGAPERGASSKKTFPSFLFPPPPRFKRDASHLGRETRGFQGGFRGLQDSSKKPPIRPQDAPKKKPPRSPNMASRRSLQEEAPKREDPKRHPDAPPRPAGPYRTSFRMIAA